MELGACLDRVRERRPLIHCITNYVTANDVANLLLACGASPIMADEPEEVEEITARCAGLCLNLGTPSRRTIPSLMRAGVKAGELGRPVVLDPVGVGASALRLPHGPGADGPCHLYRAAGQCLRAAGPGGRPGAHRGWTPAGRTQ